MMDSSQYCCWDTSAYGEVEPQPSWSPDTSGSLNHFQDPDASAFFKTAQTPQHPGAYLSYQQPQQGGMTSMPLSQELLDISGAISQAFAAYAGSGSTDTSLSDMNVTGTDSLVDGSPSDGDNSMASSPSSPAPSSSSTTSSSPKKSRGGPVRRVHQRGAANMRERRRMKTINDAFEGLRDRIPLASCDRKLSKVDTLRLAIRYIQHLSDMVTTCDSTDPLSGARESEAAKVIIRYHQPGYPTMTCGEEGYNMTGQYPPLYGHSLSWQGQKPLGMCTENKMAAKVWTPAVASRRDLDEMKAYAS